MDENFLIDFGDRLSNLRKSKGLSQKQLADLLGYKQPASISGIESGKTPTDIIALVKIADALQVDLHWLITGEHINPQKRLDSHFRDVSTQYNALVMEYEAAQETVADLESQKEKGVQLTPEQQQLLLVNRGRVRSLPRMMEQFIKQQAEILKAMQQPPQNEPK